MKNKIITDFCFALTFGVFSSLFFVFWYSFLSQKDFGFYWIVEEPIKTILLTVICYKIVRSIFPNMRKDPTFNLYIQISITYSIIWSLAFCFMIIVNLTITVIFHGEDSFFVEIMSRLKHIDSVKLKLPILFIASHFGLIILAQLLYSYNPLKANRKIRFRK